ncbi:MAG: hypothetical protein KDC26_06825 [Armatimonadetes bacterium]|nr:hypothetical protein [Armatimonadota bacterium]
MTLVAIVISVASFAQQGYEVPAPWYSKTSVKLPKTAQWQNYRETVQNRISFLRKDTLENRRARILKISTMPYREYEKPENAYLLSEIYVAFYDILRGTQAGNNCANAIGLGQFVDDREYLRSLYTAGWITGGVHNSSHLGRKLLDLYPNDSNLKMAYIFDSYHAHAKVEDRIYGLEILDQHRSKLTDFQYYRFKSEINLALLAVTKDRKWLKPCEESIAKATQLAKSDDAKKISSRMREALNYQRRKIRSD